MVEVTENKTGDTLSVPKGFKQTEVGVIPEDWGVVALSDIISFQGGSQPPIEHFRYKESEGYIRFIQIRDYKTDNAKTYIPLKLARRFCKADDVMIGRYGPPIFQILRGLEGAYNVALIKAIPKKTISKEFCYHILKRNDIFSFVETLSKRTGGQTGVNLNVLKAYKIQIPTDESEQTAIATALSDMDALIEAQEALLAKKRALKQGAMQELLTGKRRLVETDGTSWQQTEVGRIPGDWEVVNFNEVFSFKQGVQRSVEKQKKILKKGLKRFIRIIDLTDPLEPPRYIQDPGSNHHVGSKDLFMVRYGSPGLLGYGVDGVIANNLFRLLPKKLLATRFYYYYLSYINERITSISGSSTMPAISFSTLGGLAIIYPPTLTEQRAIAAALSDMDRELEQFEAQLAKYRQLKRGMMQELLTGRKRLI